MSEKKEDIKLLEEIRDQLKSINAREETDELFSESNGLIQKAEKRSDDALNKIGSSFDRIHDKLFTFNNILIAAFLGLSKYPSEDPIFDLWSVFLPIVNLVFLIVLEKMQMEIYRHASLEMKWDEAGRLKYGRMIRQQNLRSLLAIITTLGIFFYLFIKVTLY